MVFNFLEFIFESKGRGIPYFFSKKLNDFLFDIIKHNTDKEVIEFIYHILDQESNISIISNFTFVDMSDKNDTVTFIQSNRIHQIYKDISTKKDEFQHWIDYEKIKKDSVIWTSSLRSESRVGKTFKKIMSDGGKIFSDSIIERFVNIYKSNYDFKFNLNGRFDLVSGDLIKHFYLEKNNSGRGGQLSNSCMRYSQCQEYFEIYSKNTDVCDLLVLYDSPSKEKISGRSLIWKCVDGSIYMDRVYTNTDSDINLFYEYAKLKDWNKDWKYDRQVQLKEWTFKYYPYMDTFCVLDTSTGVIFSDDKIWDKELKLGNLNILSLRQTDGSALNSKSVVWSEYDQQYLNRDESVYIESHDDWVSTDSAIYVEYIDSYVHPNEMVFWSEYFQDYILKNDYVVSKCLSDNIFKNQSIDIVISNTDGKIEHDAIPEDFESILHEVVCHGRDGEDIKSLSLPSYMISNPISNINYLLDSQIPCYLVGDKHLTKPDSLVLGMDVGDDITWINASDYIQNLPTRKSKDEVISYIQNLQFDVKDYTPKISTVSRLLSRSWTPNYRTSAMRNFTDKFTDSEISELIKKCLLNFDLSMKFLPTDLSINNNSDIIRLNDEFISRNGDDEIVNKLKYNSVSKLFLLTECLVLDLLIDKDILLSWYKTIVFK